LCCVSVVRVIGGVAGGENINKYAVNTLQLCCCEVRAVGSLCSIDYSNVNQCWTMEKIQNLEKQKGKSVTSAQSSFLRHIDYKTWVPVRFVACCCVMKTHGCSMVNTYSTWCGSSVISGNSDSLAKV